MMSSISKAVVCAAVSVLIAAASCVHAETSWYSPVFSVTEDGEILDIALENESGDSIETKTFADPAEQTFYVQVRKEVDTFALVPELEVTDGYEIEPEPGVSRDFSESVTYTLSSEKSYRSFEWQVKVFDADTGMIFNSDAFNKWQPIEKNFGGGKLDNSEGLYFESSADAAAGSWALFYYKNPKPVVRIAWKSDRNEHHGMTADQLLDLAPIPSEALAESNWTDRQISEPEKLVRWRISPQGTGGKRISRVNLSDSPVEGPIAIRYKRTESRDNTYWMGVKKVMLRFASK